MQKREIEKSWVQSRSHFSEDELMPAVLRKQTPEQLDELIYKLIKEIEQLKNEIETQTRKVPSRINTAR